MKKLSSTTTLLILECEDCGEKCTSLIVSFDPEHGEFKQCPKCYEAYEESFKNEEEELKPCIFCGSGSIGFIKEKKGKGLGGYCWCADCSAQGPWSLYEEKAIEAWNKREGK